MSQLGNTARRSLDDRRPGNIPEHHAQEKQSKVTEQLVPLFVLSEIHPHPPKPLVIRAWWMSYTGYKADPESPPEVGLGCELVTLRTGGRSG